MLLVYVGGFVVTTLVISRIAASYEEDSKLLKACGCLIVGLAWPVFVSAVVAEAIRNDKEKRR